LSEKQYLRSNIGQIFLRQFWDGLCWLANQWKIAFSTYKFIYFSAYVGSLNFSACRKNSPRLKERKKERKNYLNHIYFQNLMELLDNFINIILMILLEELIKKRKYKIMG
jgi:hypothetical protein